MTEQGLIAAPDSHIRSVHDLARPGVRFIKRQSGAAGAPRSGESSVGAAVAAGRADAAFGLRADATRYGLDFVPLTVERYFLAFPKATAKAPAFQALLDAVRAREFAQCVARLPGYDGAKAGTRAGLAAALDWVRRRTPKRAAR